MKGSRADRADWARPWPIALAAWLALSGAAEAAPTGEQVVAGEVAIQREGSTTRIEASDGSIIDFQSFDILRHETVRFVQPHEAARVLNRVIGRDPTQIDGALLANGRVYIANPAGIFIGREAVIDVGALIAAAGHIADADFLAGRDRFTGLSAEVENLGTVEAASVALLGRTVANHGAILAPEGTIALVAGERVFFTTHGGRILVEVDGPADDPQLPAVANTGTLDAAGGEVLLATGDLYSLAINHTGVTRGRRIRIEGGEGGLVRLAGRVDASDPEPGGVGGEVEVLGERVWLDAAEVDASGETGGGRIWIGGGPRGEAPVQNARRTYVSTASELRADALGEGDGGELIVWSEEATGFFGGLSARGGARGGDGGFAEISGARALEARGRIDLGSAGGESGTLLYDPVDIEIVGGSTDGSDSPDTEADRLLEGDGGAAGSILFGDAGDGADPFLVFESELEKTDADIVLEARNSIAKSGDFSASSGPDPDAEILEIMGNNDLTLRTRNVPGDAAASLAGRAPGIQLAGLELRAAGTGRIVIATGRGGAAAPEPAEIALGSLATEGGSVSVSAANGALSAGAISTTAGAAGARAGNVTLQTNSVAPDAMTPPPVASIELSGDIVAAGRESSTGAGGAGGAVVIRANGTGDIHLIGGVIAAGGNALPDPMNAGVQGAGGAGGGIDVDTANGSIAVGALAVLDASGGDGASGGDVGRIAIDARAFDAGPAVADIAVDGAIRMVGGSGAAGDGGGAIPGSSFARLEAASGALRLSPGSSVDTSGGAGSESGGDAAAMGIFSGADGVFTEGSLVARGGAGAGTAPGGTGGGGGFVWIHASDGPIEVGSVDVRGGDAAGSGDGGAGGAVRIGDPTAATAPALGVTLAGPLSAPGGASAGGAPGRGGEVEVEVAGAIEGSGSGPQIRTTADVRLAGASIGAALPVEIDAADPASAFESALRVETAGTAAVAVTGFGFESIEIAQGDLSADVDITQAGAPGGDAIQIEGGADASRVRRIDAAGNGTRVSYALSGDDPTLLVPGDAVIQGVDTSLRSEGDLVLGGGPQSLDFGGTLRFGADSDSDGVGEIRVDAPALRSSGDQIYESAVRVRVDTALASQAGEIRFEDRLEGPGAAALSAGAGISFAGGIGTTTPVGGLSLATPGPIEFLPAASRVVAGAAGIALDPAGRSPVPELATSFKRSGPLAFETTGSFRMGSGEKLSVPGRVEIRAAHAALADVAALELFVDAPSTELVGRDPGPVLLPDGTTVTDTGADLVANAMAFTSVPTSDGQPTRPTLFTASGVVIVPGGIADADLRLIDARGGGITSADFFEVDPLTGSPARGGPVLDLTGRGPAAVADPSTQIPQEPPAVEPFLVARFSRESAAPASAAGASDVLAFLRCGEIPGAAPLASCAAGAAPDPARFDDGLLASERLAEAARRYRLLVAQTAGAGGAAFRAAFEAYRAEAHTGLRGRQLRGYLEASAGRSDALASLDELAALLAQLGITRLPADEAWSVRRELLQEALDRLAAPGLTPDLLNQAAGPAQRGLILQPRPPAS